MSLLPQCTIYGPPFQSPALPYFTVLKITIMSTVFNDVATCECILVNDNY
jgi:hypothetical protein